MPWSDHLNPQYSITERYIMCITRLGKRSSHIWAVLVDERYLLAVVLPEVLDKRLLTLNHQVLEFGVDLVPCRQNTNEGIRSPSGTSSAGIVVEEKNWRRKNAYAKPTLRQGEERQDG